MGIRGVKKPHPLDPGYAGVSQFLARGAGGVKRPHPLGSVPSRSGASQLTAESGVASVTVPGVKISALPAAAGGTASDQFEVNQGGTSKRLTTAQLATALPPVDWSSITGKPTSLPPNGPAGGDLSATYPNPLIKPSVTNGQVLTTVGGVSAWAAPAGGAPSGAAGGALTGTYPNPTLVGGPLSNYALTSSIPTTLPPNGVASGDLAGSYPSPTIKANVALTGNPTAPTPTAGDNDTSIATTAFVQTAVAGATGGAATLAAGAVGYGSASNVLTGVLADFAWDATNKRLGVGTATPGALAHFNSTVAGTKALIVRGTTTSAAQDYFDVVLTDPTGGGGSAMRVMGGPTGIAPLYQVDRAGDTQVSGWHRALSLSALVTNGADYFGYMLGNGAGGNLGTFAGLGAPAFSTFGSYGSLYLNGSSPGLPYYNSNGTTGWDRLVGETATQTLTNKTLTSPTITGTPAITGYLPLGGGTLTGPLTVNDGDFALRRTGTDSAAGVLFNGVTRGVRFGFDATGTQIEGVDNTGVGSFQPLTLSGTAVNVTAPLAGTTATMSTAIPAGSNDTTVATTAWVRANPPGADAGCKTTVLGANVALNNTTIYISGPSTGSIGAAGQKWRIGGKASFNDGTGLVQFGLRVWDGAAMVAGSEIVSTQGTASAMLGLSTEAIVTLTGPTTFTLQGRDFNFAGGTMYSGYTSITAERLT